MLEPMAFFSIYIGLRCRQAWLLAPAACSGGLLRRLDRPAFTTYFLQLKRMRTSTDERAHPNAFKQIQTSAHTKLSACHLVNLLPPQAAATKDHVPLNILFVLEECMRTSPMPRPRARLRQRAPHRHLLPVPVGVQFCVRPAPHSPGAPDTGWPRVLGLHLPGVPSFQS